MGGMRGDTYVFYNGMDADQEQGIHALFNDAEVGGFFFVTVINLDNFSHFKIGFYGAS